eukprot:3553074-Pleurochrysis_carterae.AAC.1
MAGPAVEFEQCICCACKEAMVDMDGKPRAAKDCGHDCSNCKQTMHAPMVCKFVWFPVVSSNAREFCSKECLLQYNKRKRDEEEPRLIVPE